MGSDEVIDVRLVEHESRCKGDSCVLICLYAEVIAQIAHDL